MSVSTPERRILPRRSFGVQESAVQESPEGEPNVIRRVSSRISLWSNRHKPTFVPWWTKGAGENGEQELPPPTSGRAPIPTMMQSSGEAYTTPLPILSMIVLSIVRIIDVQFGLTHNLCLTDNAWRVLIRKRLHAILTIHGQRYTYFFFLLISYHES